MDDTSLHCLVADDEPHIRDRICRLAQAAGLKVVASAASGTDALHLILQHEPAIAFLDIRMPGLDGLELIHRLSAMARPPVIVYVTAHDEHAIAAFELSAVDYVMKPVEAKRFGIAVDRAAAIPAALITGIRSDLPGQITAQVTQNVYDSPSGRYLLLPQGTRLIGEYDNGVGFGQRRVLLVWNRLILPNGRSIVLERLPGADGGGYAGLEDGVDHHWWDLAKAAALSSLLNIGAELATDDSNEIAAAIRDGAQDTIGDAGEEIVRRQVGRAPTLTIRPGFQVRVIVTRDLILEPQRGLQ